MVPVIHVLRVNPISLSYPFPFVLPLALAIGTKGLKVCKENIPHTITFTYMHLADAFIQSDLQCIQAIHLYCQYVCVFPGNRTHNLCAANAML